MMTLCRIIGEQWHAVERDLITLGFRREDVGTSKLSLWELISIVVAAPPGTAVYHAETRNGQLTPEAQLMATGLGIAPSGPVAPQDNSSASHKADSLDSLASLPDYWGVKLTALPVNELQKQLADLREKAAAAGGVGERTKVDKYDPWGAARRKSLGALI